MSISPKKGFCIVKIWNNNSSDFKILEEINNELSSYIDLNSCFYKSHVDNISKDLKKREKKERFLNNKKNISTNNNWNKRNKYWKYK